jgi:hypothetical protein
MIAPAAVGCKRLLGRGEPLDVGEGIEIDD